MAVVQDSHLLPLVWTLPVYYNILIVAFQDILTFVGVGAPDGTRREVGAAHGKTIAGGLGNPPLRSLDKSNILCYHKCIELLCTYQQEV